MKSGKFSRAMIFVYAVRSTLSSGSGRSLINDSLQWKPNKTNMWTTLFSLVLLVGAVKCRAVDRIISLDERNEMKATRDVTPAELDFINDMAQHSAIAHCENLDPQFNCTAGGCQNSPNVTLIQVRSPQHSPLRFRNSGPPTLRNWRATWLETMGKNGSSLPFVEHILLVSLF
jgi:hypothetical protein